MSIEQIQQDRVRDITNRLQELWRVLMDCPVCKAMGNPKCKQCEVNEECRKYMEIMNPFFNALLTCNNSLVALMKEKKVDGEK